VSRAGPVYMHRYFHFAQICVLFLLCFLSHKQTKFQELEVRRHVDLLLCVCGSSRRLIKSVFFF